MFKPKRPVALAGAWVAAMSLGGLWACAPSVSPSGAHTTGSVTAQGRGAIAVGVRLPSDQRQVAAMVDDLDGVELEVASPYWSPKATTSFSKSDLSLGMVWKTFPSLPAGPATISACVMAGSTVLASSSQALTVLNGETATASLTLSLTGGMFSSNLDVTVPSFGSFGPPSTPGTSQSGSAYAGEAACQSCHATQHATYRTTAHWTFQSRVDDNGNPSPNLLNATNTALSSCISCHVVGQDPAYPGATYSIKLTGGLVAGFDFTKLTTDPANTKFVGVQCESCHGPGARHVVDEATDSITRVPDYATSCLYCHNTAFNKTWPATGSSDVDVNANGGNAYPHHPQSLVYLQNGAWTNGTAITTTNAHKTQVANGCITCHMDGNDSDHHQISIKEKQAGVVTAVCQQCHGAGFTTASLSNFQAQTKMAVKSLEQAMVEYRKQFARAVTVGSNKTLSNATADIANMSNVVALWDDSPTAVTNATVIGATVSAAAGYITSNKSTWSPHQTTYNRAFWNYQLMEEEKSWGIHAPTYTQTVLRNTYNSLVTDLLTTPASANWSVLRLR